MYVYKVIFQILFATSPVVVFFIVRNYTTPVFAFLSAFIFMSFPTFFNDMPMLMRQEIALIFFGLALYMLLERTQPQQPYTQFDTLPFSVLSFSMRRILFIIFALSVIVSHYSTNYILLALLAFSYFSTLIISLPFVKKTFALLISKSPIKQKYTFPNKVFLNLPLILLLFLMTYVWGTLYTHTSSHAVSVMKETVRDMFVKTNYKSTDVTYSIFFSPKLVPQQELQDYINSLRQSQKPDNTYSKSITDKYPTYLVPQELLPPTPLGNLLSSFHIPVSSIQAKLRSLSASFMQILVLIGLPTIFFLKNKKTFELQYLLLCFGSIFLLALITLLPALSEEYGALRMFLQFLFVFSLLIVFGLSSILFFVKEQRRILYIGIIAIIFFLNLTGFIAHLTGDFYPQMTTDNAGLYYDAYYVQGSDVVAIDWLSKNDVNNDPILAEQYAISKLWTYGDIKSLDANFPPLIPKNAYVYLQVSAKPLASYQGTLYYNSDKPFLDKYKNLIYSNGKNNIYK